MSDSRVFLVGEDATVLVDALERRGFYVEDDGPGIHLPTGPETAGASGFPTTTAVARDSRVRRSRSVTGVNVTGRVKA